MIKLIIIVASEGSGRQLTNFLLTLYINSILAANKLVVPCSITVRVEKWIEAMTQPLLFMVCGGPNV